MLSGRRCGHPYRNLVKCWRRPARKRAASADCEDTMGASLFASGCFPAESLPKPRFRTCRSQGNNVLAHIVYPDGTAATYEYDLLGRMTKMTDAEAKATTYAYDAASQLISQIYPNNWKEYYEYDAAGQQIKVLDINPKGWLTKKTAKEYWYDATGSGQLQPAGGRGVFAWHLPAICKCGKWG